MANGVFLKISEEVIPNITNLQKGYNMDGNFEVIASKFAPIIKSVVDKAVYPSSISREDLEQEALICLWRCANRYDTSKGASFYTYFYSVASKDLFNYIFMYKNTITMNRHELERNKKIRKFAKDYTDENGVPPTKWELVEAGFSVEAAEMYLFTSTNSCCPISDYSEELPDNKTDERFNLLLDNEELNGLLGVLNEKIRQILILRYFRGDTYNSICKKLKLSISEVRAYEKEGLDFLKMNIKNSRGI